MGKWASRAHDTLPDETTSPRGLSTSPPSRPCPQASAIDASALGRTTCGTCAALGVEVVDEEYRKPILTFVRSPASEEDGRVRSLTSSSCGSRSRRVASLPDADATEHRAMRVDDGNERFVLAAEARHTELLLLAPA